MKLSALVPLVLASCAAAPTEPSMTEPAAPEPPGASPTAAAAPAPPVRPAPPAAREADVATLDGLMAAVYDVISGPAGAPRDWERFRSLFHPTLGRLTAVGRDREGRTRVRVLTPDEYVRNAGGHFEQNPFFESELARRTERFGHVASVFSTYESRTEPGGEPFARGVNAFQLLWDDERWWVVSIFWDEERPDQPIPARYLTSPE